MALRSLHWRPRTNRALFWADVEEVRAAESRFSLPIRFWQVNIGGQARWDITVADLDWLKADMLDRAHVDDRRIALSAVVWLLREAGSLETSLPELRAAIAGQPALEEDLTAHLTPQPENPEETSFRRETAERSAEAAREQDENKETWRQFRNEIAANPKRLTEPARLTEWAGVSDLLNLSRWLCGHTGHSEHKRAALRWQEIAVAFGQEVAEAYKDGMTRLWRLVSPERPQRPEGGGTRTKWANTLAFAGIGIEASLRPDWASFLTASEAAIAARHACLCEEGYPAWLDALLEAHRDAVLPIIRQELEAEWRVEGDQPGDILDHLTNSRASVSTALKGPFLEIVTSSEAGNARKAELGLRFLQGIDLNDARQNIARVAASRLEVQSGNDDGMLLSLAMLFIADADGAITRLKAWIDAVPEPRRKGRAELALARLFGRYQALITGALPTLSTSNLSDLAHFTYVRVSPAEDAHHDEGSYTPDIRDGAESARNSILTVLIDRPGEEAYLAVKSLADAGIPTIQPTRFRELAHLKAERDAEFTPWQPGQILSMESLHTAPIITSDDLMRVVLSVLADIQRDLTNEDASSRKLLLAAENEDQIQNWLHEQLRLRSRGRYHAHREPEVAEKNEPDIVVSAIRAPIELAIEVKHGGKETWTVLKLETALRIQLIEDYLRTQARRRGILVITHHGNRTWRAPEDNAPLNFAALIERLQNLAKSLTSNATGPIKAAVVGIDTALTRSGNERSARRSSRKK